LQVSIGRRGSCVLLLSAIASIACKKGINNVIDYLCATMYRVKLTLDVLVKQCLLWGVMSIRKKVPTNNLNSRQPLRAQAWVVRGLRNLNDRCPLLLCHKFRLEEDIEASTV
jgi:hypothetical protein